MSKQPTTTRKKNGAGASVGRAIARVIPALRPAGVTPLARPADEYTESIHLRLSPAMLGDVNALVNTRNECGIRTERSQLIRTAIAEYLTRNQEPVS